MALLLSTVAALGAAELIAGLASDFAFPFLNVYVADPLFGVRLEPDTSTRTVSREGRVTRVSLNGQGFRGSEWTAAPGGTPVDGRVLLVGDSQVFGYGVDLADTLAERLADTLDEGAEVLNAAVPTWGPPEYTRILRELLPIYRPATVVFVANLANDWFEVRLPNHRRTTARDGWASHRLVGVEEPSDFPGRRWLLGRSHLVHALRTLANGRASRPPQTGVTARRLLEERPHLMRADGPYRSRVTRHLRAAAQLARAQGARLVLAVLPLDVQVHPGEWAKYGEPAQSLDALLPLAAGLMQDAHDLDIPAVDLLSALAAASPGAFLPDDYHLSPRGHAAVARAIGALLRRTAPTQAAAR